MKVHVVVGLALFLVCRFPVWVEAQPPVLATPRLANVSDREDGNGDSSVPLITPDGRYVLFASLANNLAVTSSNTPFAASFPPHRNVFVRDLLSGTTTLVSVGLDGISQANGECLPRAISTNGQFVLFESDARNLVSTASNGVMNVFRRDLNGLTTSLISVSTNGLEANADCLSSVMSADGNVVAFASLANNLAPGDTNTFEDVYVRDVIAGTTTFLSEGLLNRDWGFPSGPPLPFAGDPVLSSDGRYAGFLAINTGIASSGYVGTSEVYIYDRNMAALSWPSHSISNWLGKDYLCSGLAFNEHGDYLAFQLTFEGPYGSSPTNWSGNLIRYSVNSGNLDLMATNAFLHYGSVAPTPRLLPMDASSCNSEMSPDGQKVAYLGVPPEFVVKPSKPSEIPTAIYLWDAVSGITTLVSGDPTNGISPLVQCDSPSLDSSGRYLCFLSTATNLTSYPVTSEFHLYVRDLLFGTTQLIDLDPSGTAASATCAGFSGLTADGRWVAFESQNQHPADGVRRSEIYLADLVNHTNTLVSVANPGVTSRTESGLFLGSTYVLDGSGRYVAVVGSGRQLGGTSTGAADVYLLDQLQQTSSLVSLASNGLPASGSCPSFSYDGRYLSFLSTARNIAPGNASAYPRQAFLRDLQLGTTKLLTGPTNGHTTISDPIVSQMMSPDGSTIMLTSSFFSGRSNVWILKTATGLITQVPSGPFYNFIATPDLRFIVCTTGATNGACFVWDSLKNASTSFTGVTNARAISADGHYLAYANVDGLNIYDRTTRVSATITGPTIAEPLNAHFCSNGVCLVYQTAAAVSPLDTNGVTDIYAYDMVAGTNALVTHAYGSASAGNGVSGPAVISANGRFIAYRSTASNLVPNDNNGQADVFLYDRTTGLNVLLSQNAAGASGNYRSRAPQFSGDGQTVFFDSLATDLAPNDLNQSDDLFSVKIYVADPTGVLVGQIMFLPASSPHPTIHWPAVAGKNYSVQYKTDLNSPSWHNLDIPTVLNGDQGSVTDTTSGAVPRFYRVIAN